MRLIFFALSLITILSLTSCHKSCDKSKKDHGSACTKNDIKLAINPDNHQFPKQMDACASDAWGDAEKTSHCLKSHYPGLSQKCTDCFGKMAQCAKDNCKLACMSDHFSNDCLACTKTHCKDEKPGNDFSLEQCSGLKSHEQPPLK